MKELQWTGHARFKMKYYGLSESKVRGVLRNPERVEEGIAEETGAMMQTNKASKKPYEIWVMFSNKKLENGKQVMNIISAWKYPGKTKPGEPLPVAIMRELREAI